MSLLDNILNPIKPLQFYERFSVPQLAPLAIQEYGIEALRHYRLMMPFSNMQVNNSSASCSIDVWLNYSNNRTFHILPGQTSAVRGQPFDYFCVKNTSATNTLAAGDLILYVETFR